MAWGIALPCHGSMVHGGEAYIAAAYGSTIRKGLSDANMTFLEEAAVALRSCHGAWVVGGDWNISPELLKSSKWLDLVGGVIF